MEIKFDNGLCIQYECEPANNPHGGTLGSEKTVFRKIESLCRILPGTGIKEFCEFFKITLDAAIGDAKDEAEKLGFEFESNLTLKCGSTSIKIFRKEVLIAKIYRP